MVVIKLVNHTFARHKTTYVLDSTYYIYKKNLPKHLFVKKKKKWPPYINHITTYLGRRIPKKTQNILLKTGSKI